MHWDPATGWLWALGSGNLVALDVTGPPDAPRLVPVRTVPLPTSGGHDLAPVYASPGRLWGTITSGVYQYSWADEAFLPFAGQAAISRPGVKSVGDDPVTGRILTAAPEPGGHRRR
ncbi:DUF6528 family protein [Streptomyces sp. NPDC051554]|uniref:DUF6528 family protein n=1 Tax=Streptomyces sp. NPDC051554 TaxID=3365656 RepID=UPI0037930493